MSKLHIRFGGLLLVLLWLTGCATNYDDRFEGRLRGSKTGGSQGSARGGSTEETTNEDEGLFTQLAILDATFRGELGPFAEVTVDSPNITYSNGPGSTVVTLTDDAFNPRSMVMLAMPFDLVTVDSGDYRGGDGGLVTGCSGSGQGFDWDDTAPPVEVEIEHDPDEPSLLRLDYSVNLADSSWAEGTLWAEIR